MCHQCYEIGHIKRICPLTHLSIREVIVYFEQMDTDQLIYVPRRSYDQTRLILDPPSLDTAPHDVAATFQDDPNQGPHLLQHRGKK